MWSNSSVAPVRLGVVSVKLELEPPVAAHPPLPSEFAQFEATKAIVADARNGNAASAKIMTLKRIVKVDAPVVEVEAATRARHCGILVAKVTAWPTCRT